LDCSIFLGNILGLIVASLQGWHDFNYDKPGAVFYAAIQSGLGAYLALFGSKKWLGDGRFVRIWLAISVWLGAIVVVGGLGLSLYFGKSNVISWGLLCSIVGLVAVEVIRRMPEGEFS
jgi:hypothetical protein